MIKLSIVIICWNDREVLEDCLASIYREPTRFAFEVILTDNGSTDGSTDLVRARFPTVRILESAINRGYAGANNRGFLSAVGEYVLVLNPDTIVQSGALEKLVDYADRSPDAGAFGCRILNADHTYQCSAYPIPSVRGYLVAALYLRFLGRLSAAWSADTYAHWGGTTKRDVGFQAGCCLLVRRLLLEQLHGFDETLFHQFEDADLCLRIQQHGHTVRYFPDAEVIHLGGRNRGRYPLPVVLETYRSRYRFFLKHYGETGAHQIRWVTLIGLGLRRLGYGVRQSLRPTATQAERLKTYRILFRWHWKIDPVAFVTSGREPDVGVSPLRPARVDAASACSK